MKILVYYNVLNKNINVIFDSNSYLKVGDYYKINSLLVSIIDVNKKPTPIKIVLKKLNNFKNNLGSLFISIGEHLQGRKPRKTTIIEKRVYPWWKY